jgi:hypothetical protein
VHGSEAATPENRFSGKNRTRYMNPELDPLIDRYFATIPTQERLDVRSNMLHIMSDQVIALGVFYGPEPMLINKRLINVNNAKAPSSDETWNGHLWDVR